MEFYQVDAFSDRPFRGNPAAVFVLPCPAPVPWMLSVAAEMNLSETAFLRPRGPGWSLRWFTPKVEVPLCGHGTLSAAHVLWEEGLAEKGDTLRFHTRSGVLTARNKGKDIELDFPALALKPGSAPQGLARALGAAPRYVGRGPGTIVAELGSEEAVRGLEPDFKALNAVSRGAFIVTALSRTRGLDFVSRVFAPGEGIDEDPVTGSAHCVLGPYWRERLGKSDLTAFQASARGGGLGVSVRGRRVLLTGRAVTVFKGRLNPVAGFGKTA